MQHNGRAWVSADGHWAWDGYRWRRLRSGPRRTLAGLIVAITVVCALPLLGYANLALYSSLRTDSQPMASIGGCPSSAFPVPPGSTQDEVGGLSLYWPPGDLGCWTANSENGSENDVFAYYMDPSHTSGWIPVYSYPETKTVRFRNVARPQLYADASVGGHLLGHAKTRLDIILCFCNPDIFIG
jgi:hypothetical protein